MRLRGRSPTSAGATAGPDLCLHMIRRDYGPAVAAEAAPVEMKRDLLDQVILEFLRGDPVGRLPRRAPGIAATLRIFC